MPDHPSINVALYAQTDVGMVRSGNEDNFLILDLSTGTSWSAGDEEPQELLTFQQGYYGTLLAVSDGMGGALAGEVASRLAVETVRDRMLQLQAHIHYSKLPFHERLRLAIEEANILIHADGLGNPSHKGLGATFTAVATAGNKAYFAQVGDSRAYLIREGKVARITKDQSLVQQLIDAGQITEEEAETHSYRNVILQALGAHTVINVEVNTLPLCHLDTLVLCSDGLSGKMHADEIAAIVNQAADFKTACQHLIALANQRGGEDNITVVVAQFSGAGLLQKQNDTIEPQGIARSPDTPTELNWVEGSEGVPTDQLTDPVGAPLDGAATEPLPKDANAAVVAESTQVAIPAPPSPTTSPLVPRTQRRNTNELDRPITMVWEFDPAQLPPSPSSAHTEELPKERTAPAPLPTKAATNNNAAPGRNGQAEQKPVSPLLAILTILALACIGGAAFWYFNQQARSDARAAKQLERQENEKRIQEQVNSLRDQVKGLDNKLRLAKVEADRREKMQKKLAAAEQQLNEINSQITTDKLDELEKKCGDIAKDLKDIEEDLNNPQGLLPGQYRDRAPVKV